MQLHTITVHACENENVKVKFNWFSTACYTAQWRKVERGHSRHLKRGHLDSKHAPDSSRYFHFKSFEYLQNLPKLAKSRFVKDTVTLTGSSNTTWLNFKISATTGPNNQQILPTGQAIRFFQLKVEWWFCFVEKLATQRSSNKGGRSQFGIY